MAPIVLDGKQISAQIRAELCKASEEISARLGRAPQLAVILVGNDPASEIYVGAKSKAAREAGIHPLDIKLPGDIDISSLEREICRIAGDPAVDGILLQLPLPKGLDEARALRLIPADLDVDGLTAVNQGRLMLGQPGHRPCTPKAVVYLAELAAKELGWDGLTGKNAVVVGRSILVGKPVSILLLEKHCTVTICHSRTKNLEAVCRSADLLVAAVGKPGLLGADCVKSGAVVIDVGINRTGDKKICGDVDYEAASKTAGAITPVPGGVGPMTIAMLLSNTVDAARAKAQRD